MQFEDFDNRVKQAAEQHHPNYDEKAWAKMEKLLDRHLPLSDDRRRRVIFFLAFVLLAVGGVGLAISKPWQQSNKTAVSTANTPDKNGLEPSAGSIVKTTETPKNENLASGRQTISGPFVENRVVANKKNNITTIDNAGNSEPKRNPGPVVASGSLVKQDKALPGKNNNTDEVTIDVTGPGSVKKGKNPPLDNAVISSRDNNDIVPGKNETPTRTDQPAVNNVSQHMTSETKKDNLTGQPEPAGKKDMAKKSGNKKGNSFFFSFSAGPDISSVGLDNPGEVELLAGAGLGYTFHNRLTIRTGFYTSRKVYSATRDEYKPSPPPNNSQYIIDNIDADCKVYEIPLTLSYHFSQSKNHSLFAAAGLSSYIMKKETYRYLYKYPGNPVPYPYTKTVNNENEHYFSVLTVSAGYQRKISKTFSIAAEPYIKVPLTGVGYGRVKLNSGGILFSVNISPFQQGAKK